MGVLKQLRSKLNGHWKDGMPRAEVKMYRTRNSLGLFYRFPSQTSIGYRWLVDFVLDSLEVNIRAGMEQSRVDLHRRIMRSLDE